jgi:predicted phosphoadenosine phosphosulfate sulfurtransferase
MPKKCISDLSYFPFFWKEMEFEEFVPKFGSWYAGEEPCACFVGIRTDESLNRFRSIATSKKACWQGVRWTTALTPNLCNVYPVYDWRTEDIWTYHAKTKTIYNRLYDRMHQAGLTIHQARICQPYGDDQKKGLWLFHVIEPETWSKVVARVNGANHGAIYAQETGHVLGKGKLSKPHGHTWESFTRLLLESMPPKTRDHFDERILKFVTWWLHKSKQENYKCFFIPDEADPKLEAARKAPSWRRICKALLRYEYWCKGLSFAPPSSLRRLQERRKEAYEQAKLIEEAASRASRSGKRG